MRGSPWDSPPPRPIKGPKWHLASRRGFPMVGGSVRSPSLRGCWHRTLARGAQGGPFPAPAWKGEERKARGV